MLRFFNWVRCCGISCNDLFLISVLVNRKVRRLWNRFILFIFGRKLVGGVIRFLKCWWFSFSI